MSFVTIYTIWGKEISSPILIMKSVTHYFDAAKYRFNTHLYKRKGWRTKRHIVVFESDDWGSVRMPSTYALNRLLSKGIKLFPELGYDRYDTLATSDDLECLFEVLESVKDDKGNPAIITLNCVMANPDFKRIKESGYKEYYYEPFITTLQNTKGCESSFKLWCEGRERRLLQPQFHGREHLNVPLWLRLLQQGNQSVLDSFEEGVFSMTTKYDNKDIHCLSAFNAYSEADYLFYENSIREGLSMFNDVFGFESRSMIAPCYLWDVKIERIANKCGIRYLQGGLSQVHSHYACFNKRAKCNQFRYVGEKNALGQIYLTRNCSFEPSANRNQGADYCLSQIKNAFELKKPAIVSVHRQNFIGALDVSNRDNNLKEFSQLLNGILQYYPDVEFMSSDELGRILLNKIS